MSKLADTIEELVQAAYYVGLYTGRGKAGVQHLKQATGTLQDVRDKVLGQLEKQE